MTKGFAWLIEHVSGGHRHGTHSLAGIAAFTGAAYVAEHYRRTLGGKIVLGLLLVLVLAAGLRALKIGGHFGDLMAIPIAWPWSRRHIRLLPEPLALTTGTLPERWVVAPGMVAALGWLVAVGAKVRPAGWLPLH